MNNPENTPQNTRGDAGSPGEDALEALFHHVPARQRPPAEDENAIRDSLHNQWRVMSRHRRRRRFTAGFALAASVILGVYLGIGLLGEPVAPVGLEIMAAVDLHQGEAWKTTPGEDVRQLSLTDGPLLTGDVIVTQDNALVSLIWVNGESIRLNSGTRLKLVSASLLELIAGQIYIDSDPAGNAPGRRQMQGTAIPSLEIETPAGTVRHIGTQYMTRVVQQHVFVSVRDGRVAIAPGGNAAAVETVIHRGEKASVGQDKNISVSAIVTHGQDWSWVEKMAPDFVMEGRSMADLLEWVARETGRDIHYRSGAAKRMAAGTFLHGSMDLAPMRALEVVMTTSDLSYELEQEMIRIAVR